MHFLDNISIRYKLFLIAGTLSITFIILVFSFSHMNGIYTNTATKTAHLNAVYLNISEIKYLVTKSRYHEKSFLASKQDFDLVAFDKLIIELNDELEKLNIHLDVLDVSHREVQAIQENLLNYVNGFHSVVAIMKRNGLSHNIGLLGELRKAVHNVEDYLNENKKLSLSESMLLMRRHEKDFISRNQNKYREKFIIEHQRFLSLLSSSDLPENIVSDIHRLIGQYRNQFLELALGYEQANTEVKLFNKIVILIQPNLDALVSRVTAVTHNKKREHESALAMATYQYWLITLIVALLSVYTVIRVSHGIRKSTNNLHSMAKEMALGNAVLSDRLEVVGQDELSETAESFNLFLDKLEAMMIEVKDMAMRMTEIAHNAHGMTSDTSMAIALQSEELSHITESIETLSNSALSITDNARTISDRAVEADNTAAQGQQHMQSIVDEMGQLEGNLNQALNSALQLDEYSKNINSITDIINGVADQTNLLALNAAIEAARAGEAGRGFAVVANEVRTLSMRITESIDQIQRQVTELQQSSKQTVKVINKSTQQATVSANVAQQAYQSISSVTESVSLISQLNNEMVSFSSKQSDMTKDITQNLYKINESTVQLSQSVDKTLSDSGDMSQVSSLLLNLSSQFGNTPEQQNDNASKQTLEECEIDLF